ncbi:MAG: muconolactone Delta-isomerase family protein, partial [Comamonas sp.]
MLFLVRMDVRIPHDLPTAQVEDIKAREKAYSQALQHDGRWQSI